jgi:hypothetical protein
VNVNECSRAGTRSVRVENARSRTVLEYDMRL